MKLGLINSAWAQAGRDTAFGIRMTKEIGFDSIDIFADPLDTDEAERTPHQGRVRPAPACRSSAWPAWRWGWSTSTRASGGSTSSGSGRTSTWPGQFEARNVLLVLGEYVWQKEVIPPAEQWAAGGRVRPRRWASTRRASGLEIALELEPFQLSLLNDVASMARFLDDVGHPAVKANLDISHLVLADQPAGLVERLRGRVAHVHISDCDGKVHGDLPPGRGVVDFAPYLEAIKGLGLDDATISIELEYSPEPDRIVDWVREAYDVDGGPDAGGGAPAVRGLVRALAGDRRRWSLVVGWPLAGDGPRGDAGPRTAGGRAGARSWPTARPGEIVRPLGLAFETVRLVLATEAIALPVGPGAGVRAVPDRRLGAAGVLGAAGAGGVRADAAARDGLARGVRQRRAGRRRSGSGAVLVGLAGGGVRPRDGGLPWVVAIVGRRAPGGRAGAGRVGPARPARPGGWSSG